ncbi:MAG TPA: hypothetical protein VMH00_02200 [Candidatus Limnocylindrales bacterium]|nr:hypothetical protein [Candidatus Limnocylindrales bacterium]
MNSGQDDTAAPGCEGARAAIEPRCPVCNPALGKLAILLLLVSLAGLATLAKDGQYYPKTNPARYVSMSTKMNVGQPTAVAHPGPLQRTARIVAAHSRPAARRTIEPQPLPTDSVGVTVSLQHRSPPTAIA